MARIEFSNLAHCYQKNTKAAESWALKPMSVAWRDGGAYALLGPSGCGKTTLLNVISGLITPTQGRILFDGIDVTERPPERRNIAQVFQFPVIYDTMTVFDNLAFPLRNRGQKESAIRERVYTIAELLDLSSDLSRRASGLAPDNKQKISLGRGLVRPDVAAVLFDEPLTTIDPQLKWHLRRKLKEIHRELKLTLIYVTHDQTEALTFADTVLVMSAGEIVQSGTAQQLFEVPEHTFVGHFIGSPGMNFFPCTLDQRSAHIGDDVFALDPALIARARAQGQPFKLGVRPEFIHICPAPESNAHRVVVRSVQPMGTHTLVTAELGSQPLSIRTEPGLKLTNDTWVKIPPERLLLYANERRVA